MVLAHFADVPVEETTRSFRPVRAAAGELAGLQICERVRDGRQKIPRRIRRGSRGEGRG
jgi:hypothetical protein